MNLPHRLLKSIAALVTVCLLLSAAAAAQVPSFDSLYVFGDSLADNGNIFIMTKARGLEPAVPPSESPHRTYFDGRFSNGYMGFEYLWQRLSGHAAGSPRGLTPFLASPFGGTSRAIDFAFGGTGTAYVDQTPGGFWAPGLKGQIELFRLTLRGRRVAGRALYAITTGANDYRAEPFNVPMDPHEAVGNIVEGIQTLSRLGARDVMVLDLPDLGLIPGHSGDPGPASYISAVHNLLLDAALNDLQSRLPRLHLIRVKLDPLFRNLILQLESRIPALTVRESPLAAVCLALDPVLCNDVSPELFNNDLGFLFWDIVHPTTQAHRSLADYLYEQLASSY
jgi:phospholipase/lecithinase/hemolysin